MTEDRLPLFPLNTVLLPGMFLPLHVFEERYRLMIAECLREEKVFGVVLIRSGPEVGGPALPHSIGTTARIVRLDAEPDGRFHLIAQGEQRFRIQELQTDRPFLTATVDSLGDSDGGEADLRALARDAGGDFKRYIALLLSFADRWIADFEMPADPAALSFSIASRLNIVSPLKQRLLEMTSIRARLTEERELMRRESAQLELLAAAKAGGSNSGPPA